MLPQELYEFCGPSLAGVRGRSVSIAVILFLVLDDGDGDAASEKVLPPDGLLMDRGSKQGVIPGCLMRASGVSEPLNQVLRYQFTDRLGGIGSVIEIVK